MRSLIFRPFHAPLGLPDLLQLQETTRSRCKQYARLVRSFRRCISAAWLFYDNRSCGDINQAAVEHGAGAACRLHPTPSLHFLGPLCKSLRPNLPQSTPLETRIHVIRIIPIPTITAPIQNVSLCICYSSATENLCQQPSTAPVCRPSAAAPRQHKSR